MSFDPNSDLPESPQKPGMSGCKKAALILGVLSVVAVLGCCGVSWWFTSQALQISEDPVKAAAAGKLICEADFLNDFKAKSSIKINIPFVGEMMTMVVFEKDDHSMVMLGQMNPQIMQGQNQQQIEDQFRQKMNEQAGKGKIQTISSKTRKLNVRGQAADFRFAQVKADEGPQKDVEMWMVTGMFEGKNGPAFIMLMVPTSEHTEDEVAGMIESIK